jgi:RNA polymerase sigma-70 factor (ECF subfamily)
LVSRCQEGDQEALRTILERNREKVYQVAYGVVRQRDEALDIAQEVFIKLFRSIGDFKGKSSFHTYLSRMAINTAIDYTRRMKKFPP